jgi:hypothetical protein
MVSLVHRAAHGRRNVACYGGSRGVFERLPRGTRAGEAPRFQSFQLLGDGGLDDRGKVAVSDLGAHEAPEPLQLVA